MSLTRTKSGHYSSFDKGAKVLSRDFNYISATIIDVSKHRSLLGTCKKLGGFTYQRSWSKSNRLPIGRICESSSGTPSPTAVRPKRPALRTKRGGSRIVLFMHFGNMGPGHHRRESVRTARHAFAPEPQERRIG